MVSLDIEVEGGCSSNCEHKIELEKLKKVLSPDDRKIPDDLWKIFSLKGEYIKNILLYSGYESIDSIMNLKNDCELTEAISFVKDMSELMDENEKKANFGIFSKQPEKLKVIPGLKPVVLRFIESVEKITKAESTVKFHQNATSKKKVRNEKKIVKIYPHRHPQKLLISSCKKFAIGLSLIRILQRTLRF